MITWWTSQQGVKFW